jgi:sulfate adenylyltransferase subunit 1
VYNNIKTEYEKIAITLKLQKIYFIPISARDGDNVVDASVNTPWYHGVTLLHLLETIPVHNTDSELPARFPVQYVINPNSDKFPDYKGYAGRVSGGVFRVGDTILALPSVTIRLNSVININRGDMLVKVNSKYPKYSSIISLHVCWLNARPLQAGGKYIVRHTTNETVATIQDIRYKVNINTLENIKDDKTVLMNDIAHITIKTQKPLKYDDYSENRITGSLILIDENTFETVAAGMIISDPEVYSYSI